MRMCYDNLIRLFGNSFWGMQFAPFSHKTALDGHSSPISLVSRKNGAKPHHYYFDCDSLHESATNLTQIYNSRHCEANRRFAEAIQKIAQPNLARFVVQKIGFKDAVVPSADFLLESDKRGSPPKSEKRQLLARRGSGAGGAALLRKEKGESNTDCRNSTANLAQNFRHTERSEVSKSRESNQVQNAMTKERMGESHRFAQSKKIVGDSQVAKMDSSRCRTQNDESFLDCHDSPLPNLAMTKKGVESRNDESCMDCFGDESPRNDDIFDFTIRSRNDNA